jgi:hypothetical protein
MNTLSLHFDIVRCPKLSLHMAIDPPRSGVTFEEGCVCVCACVRERERESAQNKNWFN